MIFEPTKEKCTDPETNKLCPGFKDYVWTAGYFKEEQCLIQKNPDQIRPPRWCKNEMLTMRKKEIL